MSNYTIIPYDEKYRNDMIFMVLEAKDALGRIPRLNEELLDVQKNYIDTGDMFWLAIDEQTPSDRLYRLQFYPRHHGSKTSPAPHKGRTETPGHRDTPAPHRRVVSARAR